MRVGGWEYEFLVVFKLENIRYPATLSVSSHGQKSEGS
jgi:hypothetical protein